MFDLLYERKDNFFIGGIDMKKRLLLIFGLFLFSLTSCGKVEKTMIVELVYSDTQSFYEEAIVGNEYMFTVPERFGYSFEGWYDEQNKPYTDKLGKGFNVWEESFPTKLYASWNAKKYNINLDAGNGEFESMVPNYSAYYDSDISNLVFPIPYLEKHNFVGYFNAKTDGAKVTDEQGTILPEASLFINSSYIFSNNEVTLYARYNVQTTTFLVQGSTRTFRFNVGETIYNLEYDIKDNYAFVGYYLDDIFHKKIEYPYQVEYSSNAITLYPKYEKCTEIGLSFNSISNDEEYEAIYSGDAEQLIIPDSYYGKRVTSIGRIQASLAKRIVVPNTVTTMSSGAFENNTLLEEILISKNLVAFENNVFYNCYKLKSIHIPNTVIKIGDLAFGNCESVEQIFIPESVEKIGIKAFYNMMSLKKIDVDEKNNTFKSINDVLYRKAHSSLYLIQYPIAKDGYDFIAEEGTYKVESYAFYNTNLRKIIFDVSNLCTIGEYAFSNSQKLMMVSITTKSDLTILDYAFESCSILSSLALNSSNKVKIMSTTFNNVNSNLKIFVPSVLIKDYSSDMMWKDKKGNILSLGTIFGNWAIVNYEDGVRIISYLGMEEHLEVPAIINGKKVISIGEFAFMYNEAIQELILPNSLQEIEDYAFRYDSNLQSVFISSPCVIALKGTPFDICDNINFYLAGEAKNLLQEYRNAWVNYSSHIWTANN